MQFCILFRIFSSIKRKKKKSGVSDDDLLTGTSDFSFFGFTTGKSDNMKLKENENNGKYSKSYKRSGFC